ncbi:MAG TPA: class I SAM-dependent methyltransferase [Blastocatellia bacterium]
MLLNTKKTPGTTAEALSLGSTRVLDIGCGVNKVPGAIGMDANPRTNADVVHDLDKPPYPFSDNEFDIVIGRHVMEHVHEPLAVLTELHRITRPGGVVKILVPHWTNPDWASDLTHRNHLNSYSFDRFTENAALDSGTGAMFRLVSRQVSLLKIWKAMGFQFIVNLDQRSPKYAFCRRIWEHYLNAVVRGKEIYFELEVVKNRA